MSVERFAAHWFAPASSLAERLSGFLSDVCGELECNWAAVSELVLGDGVLTTRWMAQSAAFPAFYPPSVDMFTLFGHNAADATQTFEVHLSAQPSSGALSGSLGAPGRTEQAVGRGLFLPIDSGASAFEIPQRVMFVFDRGSELDATVLDAVSATVSRVVAPHMRQKLADIVLTAIEQAPDPIEVTDLDARLFYVNRAWASYFDYRRAEVLTKTTGSLVRDDAEPAHDRAFLHFTLAALRRRDTWLGVMGSRSRSGNRRFNEVSVSPFDAVERRQAGNLAIRRDLAHRQDRDQALATVHKEFRSVLAAMPDALVVLRSGYVYFANAAFQRMSQSSETDVLETPFQSFVHPEDWDAFQATTEVSDVTTVRLLRPSGQSRLVEISSAGDVSFEGHPSRIIVARDVTEHMLTREQYSRTERLAALGALAAGVAHEINNPLAYVMLNLEGLRPDLNTAAGREAVDEALDGARRIRQIVAELRGFWNGETQTALTAVDVTSAVTSAVNLAQNEIRHRAALVRLLEPQLFALAREGQLVQVIVNLLVNAAHAIDDRDGRKHEIRVSSRRLPGDRLEIRVADTGGGITPDALATIFEPFTTTRRQGDGSGLGLTISKRIIEELNGSIEVASTGPEGTTFCIELPAAFVVEECTESRMSQPDMGATFGVLVVDDEPLVARAIKRALRTHAVTLAFDGDEALDVLKGGAHFDVILCDLMMPRVSGAELYRTVLEQMPEVAERFVFMTGGAFSDWSRRFLDTIDRPVVEKPFEPAEIRQWVEKTGRRVRRMQTTTARG